MKKLNQISKIITIISIISIPIYYLIVKNIVHLIKCQWESVDTIYCIILVVVALITLVLLIISKNRLRKSNVFIIINIVLICYSIIAGGFLIKKGLTGELCPPCNAAVNCKRNADGKSFTCQYYEDNGNLSKETITCYR